MHLPSGGISASLRYRPWWASAHRRPLPAPPEVRSTVYVQAFPAPGGRRISITVQADYADIKVTLDGQELALTDATGAVVEPFAISGTAYLPVRAISNALGLDVGWDAGTSTVILSSVPPTITAEEAEATHLANVLAEAEIFSIYWSIVDPDRVQSWDALDTAQNEIITLMNEIYDHSKYTVAPAVAQSDGSYTVEVTISPIDVVQKAAVLYESGSYAPPGGPEQPLRRWDDRC